jgi:Reverse transcriptase (RNA-dependent DNA polymerase)
MTVGGNLIEVTGDISTKGADLVTAKVLINDIISTPNCQATALDIRDFYLNNEHPTKEYVRIGQEHIHDDIWAQYNLDDFVNNQGWVCAEVSKGMYGLPQAGHMASDALLPCLALAGYKPTGCTPGLFKHSTNSIKFCLVVDDFLVGSCNPTHTEHLKSTLHEHYTITEDAAANRFCGMTLDWDYQASHVDISMPGYIEKALQK